MNYQGYTVFYFNPITDSTLNKPLIGTVNSEWLIASLRKEMDFYHVMDSSDEYDPDLAIKYFGDWYESGSSRARLVSLLVGVNEGHPEVIRIMKRIAKKVPFNVVYPNDAWSPGVCIGLGPTEKQARDQYVEGKRTLRRSRED